MSHATPQRLLGRLDRVDLRATWQSEAGDLTRWLAQPENIARLGEAIGLELGVEAQEKDVGPFRADILRRDTAERHRGRARRGRRGHSARGA